MPRLPERTLDELAPEIVRTLEEHRVSLMNGGVLTPRVKELVALMVSWLNGCSGCVDVHAAAARRLGVEKETLDELVDYAHSPKFDARERAALAAAVALTREARALPDTVWREIRAQFSESEALEIVATIGFYNYQNRLLNALQL